MPVDSIARLEEAPSLERLELTHELRLRRWARQNYVPVERRRSSWHAVILAEMRQKDRELAELEVATVALPSTPVRRGRSLRRSA